MQVIVRHAEVAFFPSVRLGNVMGTMRELRHLFQDHWFKGLTSVLDSMGLGLLPRFASHLFSLVARLFSALEMIVHVRIFKATATPVVFNGTCTLRTAFSGHVRLFGFFPIPFWGLVLPKVSYIIHIYIYIYLITLSFHILRSS